MSPISSPLGSSHTSYEAEVLKSSLLGYAPLGKYQKVKILICFKMTVQENWSPEIVFQDVSIRN